MFKRRSKVRLHPLHLALTVQYGPKLVDLWGVNKAQYILVVMYLRSSQDRNLPTCSTPKRAQLQYRGIGRWIPANPCRPVEGPKSIPSRPGQGPRSKERSRSGRPRLSRAGRIVPSPLPIFEIWALGGLAGVSVENTPASSIFPKMGHPNKNSHIHISPPMLDLFIRSSNATDLKDGLFPVRPGGPFGPIVAEHLMRRSLFPQLMRVGLPRIDRLL